AICHEKCFGSGKTFFCPDISRFSQKIPEIIAGDFEITPKSARIFYSRCRIGDDDVYFVTNDCPEPVRITAAFASNGTPWFYDPENGKTTEAVFYDLAENRRTVMPLELGGYGAVLVIFRGKTKKPHVVSADVHQVLALEQNSGSLTADVLLEKSGEYHIRAATGGGFRNGTVNAGNFPAPFKLPDKWNINWKSEFSKGAFYGQGLLGSWTDLPGLKNFSGTVEYSVEFDIPENYIGKVLVLDLGSVENIAELILNGHPAGIRCWRPYRFDVSSFVRAGRNRMTLLVTNSMGNRMDKTSVASGLLGPALLVPYERHSVKLNQEHLS
ncbi:MAG: hypothetical protein PHV82_14295, partial [Victivallaceae bacterium]|nr:hypothetical protein [Victivallaceae bacterium]